MAADSHCLLLVLLEGILRSSCSVVPRIVEIGDRDDGSEQDGQDDHREGETP